MSADEVGDIGLLVQSIERAICRPDGVVGGTVANVVASSIGGEVLCIGRKFIVRRWE